MKYQNESWVRHSPSRLGEAPEVQRLNRKHWMRAFGVSKLPGHDETGQQPLLTFQEGGCIKQP